MKIATARRHMIALLLSIPLLWCICTARSNAAEYRDMLGAQSQLKVVVEQEHGATGKVSVIAMDSHGVQMESDFYDSLTSMSCTMSGPMPMPPPGQMGNPNPMPPPPDMQMNRVVISAENLRISPDGNSVVGDITAPMPGYYTVEAELISGDTRYTGLNETQFLLDGTELSQITVNAGDEESIFYVSELAGWNNLALTVDSVETLDASDSAKADVRKEAQNNSVNSLSVRGIQSGSNKLQIRVKVRYSGFGGMNIQSAVVTGTIEVSGNIDPSPNSLFSILPNVAVVKNVSAVLLILILVAAVAILVHNRMPKNNVGRFEVICVCGGTQTLEKVSCPGGKSFTAYTLLQRMMREAKHPEDIKRIEKAIQGAKQELKNCHIQMTIDNGERIYGVGRAEDFVSLNRNEVMLYQNNRGTGLEIFVSFIPT